MKFVWKYANSRFNCYLQDGSHFSLTTLVNTLRPSQNGRHFPDDIFKCTFLNENAWISIKISLKFVPKGPMNKIPALVQIMAWHRSGDEPLSEPMMVSLLMHICVTGPQWVKMIKYCLPIYVIMWLPLRSVYWALFSVPIHIIYSLCLHNLLALCII